MPYTLEPEQCSLISAGEYLRHNRQAGRPLHLKHLDLTFYGLSDCLCCGDKAQVVLPAQGTNLRYIFRESCQYPASEFNLVSMLARSLAANPEFVTVEEAAPLYSPGSNNLWHWMTENLPKLVALESIGFSGSYIVSDGAVARQCLDLLGIDPARLLPGKGNYRVHRLMLPQRLSGFDLAEYMPLTRLTRDRLLEAVGRREDANRVYVRRIGRRKIVNEDEVLAVLGDFGFETMVPEDFSLAEQLRYMTNASCSVMAHGANAALTLMQPPRSAVVEIYGNRYVSYNNLHAVRLLKLRYHSLVEDLDVSSAPNDTMSLAEFLWSGLETDMLVDTRHLRILLESICE